MALSSYTAGRRLRASELNAMVTKVNALALPPQCKVRRAAAQSIVTATATLVSWDTEDIDTDAMFAPTSTDVTIKTAGVYVAVLGGTIAGASGLKVWEILKNGVTQVPSATTGPDTAAQAGRTNAVVEMACVVNDVIRGQVFHNVGSNQNMTGAMWVWKVSD